MPGAECGGASSPLRRPPELRDNGSHMRKIRRAPDGTPITLVLIPGGPGLPPAYMGHWARAVAKSIGTKVETIDYSVFAGPGVGHPKKRLRASLRSLAARIRKLAPRGKAVLVGHSFGARIIIELLRLSPRIASAAVLVNCPADFAPGRNYLRRKRRLRLPPAINSESDFRHYWRVVLPLYFFVRPKQAWINSLARGTNWIDTAWLNSAVSGAPKAISRPSSPPLLFINGSGDSRFPSSNARQLRSIFPTAVHAAIDGSGHFPMMENPRALTAELILFLNAHNLVDLQSNS